MLRSPDTSPEAHAVQIEIYRRMSPSRRGELALELSDALRRASLAGIRARHPEYDADQAFLALARLEHGDVLFQQAWPDAPLLDP